MSISPHAPEPGSSRSVSAGRHGTYAAEHPQYGADGGRRLRPEDVFRAFAISAVVLLIGFVLGNFTFSQVVGRGTGYFVLAAAAGVALTAVAFKRLEWVMLAFLAFAWLGIGKTPSVATGVSSGTGKSLAISQIGMTFLMIMWMVRAAASGYLPILRTRLNGFLILFLAMNVLCAISGRIFWDPALTHFYGPDMDGGKPTVAVILVEMGFRALSIGAFWVFANNLFDAVWLRRIARLFLVPGTLVFLMYLIHFTPHLDSYSLLLVGAPACMLFAWLIEPISPLVPERRGLRVCGWIVLAVIMLFVGTFALKWVSSGLNLFGGLLFVAWMRSKKLFFAMLFTGAALYLIGHGFLERTVIHKVQTSGDEFRFSMMRAAFLYAMKFPLGVGPANYRAYNAYYGLQAQWNTSTFSSAHNFYAEMLSEMGFIGLAITLLFVLAALFLLARFYRRLPAGADRTYLLGMGGMWTGICLSSGIGDYLIPVYYNGAIYNFATTIYAWVGLGIAFAIAAKNGLLSTERAQPVSAAPRSDAATYYPRRMGADHGS